MYVYTVVHKKCNFCFYDNLGKHASIFTILSLLHLHMKYGKRWNKIHQLASNLLPHYLVKFECLAAQLYSKVIQCKVTQDRLFTVNTTRDVLFHMSTQTYLQHTFKMSILSMYTRFEWHTLLDRYVLMMCCLMMCQAFSKGCHKILQL